MAFYYLNKLEKTISKEELEKTGKDDSFELAGRIMSLRIMGKLAFGHLKDETGRILVVFAKDFLHIEIYLVVTLLDQDMVLVFL